MDPKHQVDADPFVAQELATIAEAVRRAKHVLDRHDAKEGPVWRELDRAEAKLIGLSIIL
jgi:hypothetical protein